MTTEKADLTFASLPYRIMHEFQIPIYDAIRERDKDFYDRLAAAGFELDWGDDDSGLFMKYLRRGSGYYIDVGASDLVADGSIKLAHGQVDHLTEDSVVLADGTELPADVVVYATGYGSMNGWAADLIGQDVADKVGKVWGLGSGTDQGPRPVGGRTAQHVEADAAGEPVVPRRQSASVAALLAVSGAATQGAPRGHPDPGLRHGKRSIISVDGGSRTQPPSPSASTGGAKVPVRIRRCWAMVAPRAASSTPREERDRRWAHRRLGRTATAPRAVGGGARDPRTVRRWSSGRLLPRLDPVASRRRRELAAQPRKGVDPDAVAPSRLTWRRASPGCGRTPARLRAAGHPPSTRRGCDDSGVMVAVSAPTARCCGSRATTAHVVRPRR